MQIFFLSTLGLPPHPKSPETLAAEEEARKKAAATLERVKTAIGLNYRNDLDLINGQVEKYALLHAKEKD